MADNITWHNHTVTNEMRTKLKGHKACVVWLTGLSGSGKSTIANELEAKLFESGFHTYLLDGDNIRTGLSKDLTFSDNDRKENMRRITEATKLFYDSGQIVIAAFISPFSNEREWAKQYIGEENFIEVYVNCSLDVCEERDVKGLYKKARNGEIKGFTGIDSKYEVPASPDIQINTMDLSVKESVDKIYSTVEARVRI